MVSCDPQGTSHMDVSPPLKEHEVIFSLRICFFLVCAFLRKSGVALDATGTLEKRDHLNWKTKQSWLHWDLNPCKNLLHKKDRMKLFLF
jgi:hypothetical protein